MESDILKHFVDKDVEVLVGGVWIEGHLLPIAKGVVVLTPLKDAIHFYGPTSCKTEVIQAIRQIKLQSEPVATLPIIEDPKEIKSAFETSMPGVKAIYPEVRRK